MVGALIGMGIPEYEAKRYEGAVKDGGTLLSYSKEGIDLWRTGTSFCRPKWGIYRSLDDSPYLWDEQVRFNDFCIAKTPAVCP